MCTVVTMLARSSCWCCDEVAPKKLKFSTYVKFVLHSTYVDFGGFTEPLMHISARWYFKNLVDVYSSALNDQFHEEKRELFSIRRRLDQKTKSTIFYILHLEPFFSKIVEAPLFLRWIHSFPMDLIVHHRTTIVSEILRDICWTEIWSVVQALILTKTANFGQN